MQIEKTTDSIAEHVPTADAPSNDICAAVRETPLPNLTLDQEFQRLDARSIGLSRLVTAIVFSVIGIAALVGGGILMGVVPFPGQFVIAMIWLVLGGIGVVAVVWWPRWEHERWSYRVGDKVVELRHGVVWHASVSIPLSRLQHVDLHRGPLERKWGLASLEIHTAGTREASHRIPGLGGAIRSDLRDQLIAAANRGSHAAAKD